MNSGFTKDHDLAALQLNAISPLLQHARTSFIALYALSAGNASGIVEPSAIKSALDLAKSVLMLEYDLKRVLGRK